jgi:iron complex outermembrane receptor protein
MKHFIWMMLLPISVLAQVDSSKTYFIELGEASVEGISHNPNFFSTNILAVPTKTLSDQGPSALNNLTRQSPSLQLMSIGDHTMKPVIRGLGGYRTVTAYQGWRYDNLQGGADHGLDFPLLGIDHIEILPGPNSLALGTDAMGGVLYFSDLRPLESGNSNAFKLFGGTNGSPLSGQYDYVGSGKGIYYAGAYFGANPEYIDGDGDTVHGSHSRTASVRVLSEFKSGESNHKLKTSLVARTLGMPEGGHDHDDEPGDEPGHDEEEHGDQQVRNANISWESDRKFGNWVLRNITGFQSASRAEFEKHEDEDEPGDEPGHEEEGPHIGFNLISATQTTSIQKAVSDNGLLTLGAQQQFRSLQNRADAEETIYPNKNQFQSALFAHISNTKGKNKTSAGLRGEIGGFSGASFLLNWVHSLNKNLDIQSRISYGTRGPQLEERFAYGTHIGAGRFEVGDSNLTSETVLNGEVNIGYSSKMFNLQVGSYYQFYNDFIHTSPNDDSGEWRFYYLQKDALLYGVEGRLGWNPTDRIHFHSVASLTVANDLDGLALPFIAPGRVSSHLLFKIIPEKFHAEIHYDFYAEQNRLSLTEERFLEGATPSYGLWSATLTGEISSNFSWNVEILNATDVAYAHHLSLARALDINQAGRQIRAGLSLKF